MAMEMAVGLENAGSLRARDEDSNNFFSVAGRSSSSSRKDETALTWAALQRLPTTDRLRKAIFRDLTSHGEEAEAEDDEEIGGLEYERKKGFGIRDVRTFRSGTRRRFMNRVFQQHDHFLCLIKDRVDRVGMRVPTIEVRFEHLRAEADAMVAKRALPTAINAIMDALEGILNCLRILPAKRKKFAILSQVNGILKPGRLTLLLGPPGSGKSTLLKILAGKPDHNVRVNGSVTYNGRTFDEFVPQRTSAYVSQHDLHFAEMTVRETLDFSAQCQGVSYSYDLLKELARREREAHIKPDSDIDLFMKETAIEGQKTNLLTEYALQLLGLDICAETIVGDQMRRGISGGQKKRVTTGELLVARPRALFMDEISTGLDSATTYQIIRCLQQSVHIMESTMLISLLQPAPETYNIFDDVILMSDGMVVYQGPREEVLGFFESMGFKCPQRKGVADFLQEVTSLKDQEQYWADKSQPYRFVSVKEFAEAFMSYPLGKRLTEELSHTCNKSKCHPAALTNSKYGATKMTIFKACLSREWLLMRRNAFVYVFKTFQVFIVGLVAMTMFFRTTMHRRNLKDGNIYMGALFYGLIHMMFNGFPELAMTVVRLPVFYKQRDYLFYPAWAFVIPTWVAKIPFSLVEATIWIAVTYYEIGFAPQAGRFFRQFFLLFMLHQMALGLFKFVAALGRTMTISQTFGSAALVIIFVLGGFIISRENIPLWWIWGYWISPLAYSQNAVAVNEFLDDRWDKHVNSNSTVTLGRAILESRGLIAEGKMYWIGIGALLAYSMAFNILCIFALEYLNPIGRQAIITEDNFDKDATQNRNKRKSSDRLTSRGSRSNSEHRNISVELASGTSSGTRRKGMILPFQPLSMAFDKINYYVDLPSGMESQGIQQDRLRLLCDVSGSFRPGVLTALMGASGAGKTTLMDVLAGRKTGGYIEGSISISGFPKKQDTFARVSGYCEQNDIHSPHVTVYESLMYSAWLRLPHDVDASTRMKFVKEVMELVELGPLRNGLVGLPGVNGLTTEQRKRLTIAVELVANPAIIFMDEPTSGLDARAAAIVMRTVRNTVDTGRTVVCTIHQPSIDIFEAFDELLLMKRGGRVIYAGPVGHHSQKLIEYFQAIRGVSPITEGYNPATWALEVTSTAVEERLGVDFADIYAQSTLFQQTQELVKEQSKPAPNAWDISFRNKHAQPFWVQCMACLRKQRCSYWKNPQYVVVRHFYTTLLALVFGSIFWNLGTKRSKQQDLFNLMGSMYCAALFLGFNNSASAQPVVAIERTVFYREIAAGMYSPLAYAFGQIAIEAPYVLVQAVVYVAIVYSMIQFEWTAAKFMWFFYFYYTTFLYFTYFGMATVALTPNFSVAAVIASSFYSTWNLFCGFLIPRPSMPLWWRWLYWGSPVSWTLYGLVASQLGDVETTMETADGPITVKQFLKSYFGIRHDFLGYVALVMAILPIMFAMIFAVAIKYLNFQTR